MNEIYIRTYDLDNGIFNLEFTNKYGEFYSCNGYCVKEYIRTSINSSVDYISFEGGLYLPYEISQPVRVWRKDKSARIFVDGKLVNGPSAIEFLINITDPKVLLHPAPDQFSKFVRSLILAE